MKIVLLSLAIMVHLGKKRPPQGKKSSSRSSVSCDPFVQNEVLFTPTTSACCCLCPKEHLFRQVSKSFLPRLALFLRKHVLQRSPKCRVDQMATKQNMLGLRCTQSAVETSGAEQLFLLQSCHSLSAKPFSVCSPPPRLLCVFLSFKLVTNLLASLEIASLASLLAGKPKTLFSIEHNVSHP